ncbi:hypothetical protein WJU16_24450 [Chitinophaga pollutisoli]|uniref:Uncharacterized protein n=1 Tax=Chitinophaga pollutisoli TaxID=3133966 RepID=A0ABZ2YNN5_9BACT
MLRSGPIDATITVRVPANAGWGIILTPAAPDPQSGIYKGNKENIPRIPRDTLRLEVEDMMALPEMQITRRDPVLFANGLLQIAKKPPDGGFSCYNMVTMA